MVGVLDLNTGLMTNTPAMFPGLRSFALGSIEASTYAVLGFPARAVQSDEAANRSHANEPTHANSSPRTASDETAHDECNGKFFYRPGFPNNRNRGSALER